MRGDRDHNPPQIAEKGRVGKWCVGVGGAVAGYEPVAGLAVFDATYVRRDIVLGPKMSRAIMRHRRKRH